MLAPSGIVKRTAKTALRGNWLKSIVAATTAIFAVLVCIFASDCAHIVAGWFCSAVIFAAACFFLIFPLILGVLWFFRRLIWGQDDNVIAIFRYFSDFSLYKRALHLTGLMAIRLFSNGILLFSPCLIVRLFCWGGLYSFLNLSMPVWAGGLIYVSYFLGFIATLALFFVMLKIYLAPFLFTADEEMDAAEAVNMSAVISKRTDSDFFWLLLSFVGWALLSAFVMPLVFTLPYFVCSYLVHCRFAVAQYNREVDRMTEDHATFYRAE